LLFFLLALSVPGAPFAQTRITGGYVLTHEHPMNAMAFGGNYAFTGAPGNYRNGIMERGYTAEDGGCKVAQPCDHGEVKGNLTASLIAGKPLGRDMGDHASHMGPRHDSFSHVRYSTEWIRDAFDPPEREFQDSRMKIMVAFAVENEAMCEQLYYANKGKGGPGGDGYPCSRGDSIESLERQIDAIKAWVAENRDWMEIAYTSADARRIVNADKLAIILGIESEYSFGAEDRAFDPVDRLNRYYDMGVRTFYLAHKINSRLTGADIYYPGETDPGRAVRATQAISGCFYYDDNVGDFPLQNNLGHDFCDNDCGDNHLKGNKLGGLLDNCVSKFSEISEANMADYIKLRGNGVFNGFRIYPSPPGFLDPGGSQISTQDGIERNRLGLSHDGERVVREAMLKGMIVNLDHVSSKARRDMRVISREFGDYPLNALHNNPNTMLMNYTPGGQPPFRHEYDFDDNELDMVKETRGFFGVRVGPLDAREDVMGSVTTGVEANCPGTATETAKILAYLLDYDDEGVPVGYALDFATVTEAVHSRTFEGCTAVGAQDRFHTYGEHITEGLSHIGMMKKWHRELEDVGLRPEYLRQLKNDGVEQFIRMWAHSEAKSSEGTQIPRQVFGNDLVDGRTCEEDSNCRPGEFCAAGVPGVVPKRCRAKRDVGALCTGPDQCLSGRCPAGLCARADECARDADCARGEFCGDPIAGRRSCKALLAHGNLCTKAAQCATGRCAWGFCADADECRASSDCGSGQYCGDPIAGKRVCKTLLAHGDLCTGAAQCATGRCAWGFCADADECQASSDCGSGQYCGDPIAGKRVCKTLLAHGALCTSAAQCATGRCAWGFCADADECQASSDCGRGQYCGDPIAGKRTCKTLLAEGKLCTKGTQCSTGCCKPHISAVGAPVCRPADRC
jgi:microsomal dipeptidase-like Zn-dependent dipeptidase